MPTSATNVADRTAYVWYSVNALRAIIKLYAPINSLKNLNLQENMSNILQQFPSRLGYTKPKMWIWSKP